MQIKLDKTVVLVAATRALSVAKWGREIADLQRIVDILSTENSRFIQSVVLDEYEYELIEVYLQEI